MSLIKAKNIKKGFGTHEIFSDVSFSIDHGQKIALVGENGIGKTTLLKIIARVENIDGGNIDLVKNIKIGYLQQDTSLAGNKEIIKYFDKETPLHKIKSVLNGLGLDDSILDKKLNEISSGQKTKLAIIKILLEESDLILLDEPTNNLDVPALIWLENFIKDSPSAFIIVSHDRKFLDKIVSKIFEIDLNTKKLNITSGKYSDYLERKIKQIEKQREEYRLQQEEIERLENRARLMRLKSEKGSNWVGDDNDKMLRGFKRDKAKKSGKLAKTIDKRIEKIEKIEKPIKKDLLEIEIDAYKSPSSINIRLIELCSGYPSGFKTYPISLEINYGDRIGIIGLNGSGKSTLLNTIIGKILPLSGKIEIGSGVKIGDMMQEHQDMPREKKLFDFMKEKTSLSEEHIYNHLVKFGINENQVNKPISILSPGCRTRVILAIFSILSVNVLILDEPTNHLDIESLNALEKALKEYHGTIIIISHDRYFIENISLNNIYAMENGELHKYS